MAAKAATHVELRWMTIDAYIEHLDSPNREIAGARDLLLHKLVSGEIDVSKLDRDTEVVDLG